MPAGGRCARRRDRRPGSRRRRRPLRRDHGDRAGSGIGAYGVRPLARERALRPDGAGQAAGGHAERDAHGCAGRPRHRRLRPARADRRRHAAVATFRVPPGTYSAARSRSGSQRTRRTRESSPTTRRSICTRTRRSFSTRTPRSRSRTRPTARRRPTASSCSSTGAATRGLRRLHAHRGRRPPLRDAARLDARRRRFSVGALVDALAAGRRAHSRRRARPVPMQPLAARRAAARGTSQCPSVRRHLPCGRRGRRPAAPGTAASSARSPSSPATCGDLTDAAQALAAAGAAAMVAYAGDGAECAGTLDQPSPLPAFQARPFDALAPARRQRRGRAADAPARPSTSTTSSASWDGRVPAGAMLDGRREARRDVRRGLPLARRHVGRRPSGLGHAPRLGARPRPRRLRARPARRRCRALSTHYASPIAEWERTVEVRDADGRPERCARRADEAGRRA